MLKDCEYCGTPNPAAANFCRQCGKSWPPELRSLTRETPLMQQWRRLKHQMTRKEVRRVLGEPARVEPAPDPHGAERWTYEYERPGAPAAPLGGSLEFTLPDGTLGTWVEPDWGKLGGGT